MEAEPNRQFADWVLYTGPMRFVVSDQGLDPDDDPLERARRGHPAAAGGSPPDGGLSAPFLGDRPDPARRRLPAGSSARMSPRCGGPGQARAAAVAATRAGRGTCVSCGERFPQRHLVFPTASEVAGR